MWAFSAPGSCSTYLGLRGFMGKVTSEMILAEIGRLGIEMRTGFARVDARFEQVDARFEQVDARFEQVDARFEQVDIQFKEVNRELGQIRRDLKIVRDQTA